MKSPLLALLVTPLLIGTAQASSYTGPGAALADSAATAGQAADETPVVLQGHLLKRLKGDTYEFRDASGSLQVEIDDDAWPLQTIDATTRVRLSGEVDRELFGREIEIEHIEVLPN